MVSGIVGDAAERKGVRGSDDLPALVGRFRVESAVLDGVLPGLQKQFMTELAGRQRKIRKAIASIRGNFSLPSQTDDVERALGNLASEYLCSELGMHYDQISPDLFELKRKVMYHDEGKDKKIWIGIPLFASLPFGSAEEWEFGDTVRDGYDNYKFRVSSKSPPITQDAKEKTRIARATFGEIYSRALRTPVIGELLMQDSQRFNTGGGLETSLFWIPSPEEIEVNVEEINRDPFVTAQVHGKHYLVAMWDVEGEEPYQHYLKEFTERKAGE